MSSGVNNGYRNFLKLPVRTRDLQILMEFIDDLGCEMALFYSFRNVRCQDRRLSRKWLPTLQSERGKESIWHELKSVQRSDVIDNREIGSFEAFHAFKSNYRAWPRRVAHYKDHRTLLSKWVLGRRIKCNFASTNVRILTKSRVYLSLM